MKASFRKNTFPLTPDFLKTQKKTTDAMSRKSDWKTEDNNVDRNTSLLGAQRPAQEHRIGWTVTDRQE